MAMACMTMEVVDLAVMVYVLELLSWWMPSCRFPIWIASGGDVPGTGSSLGGSSVSVTHITDPLMQGRSSGLGENRWHAVRPLLRARVLVLEAVFSFRSAKQGEFFGGFLSFQGRFM